MRIFKVDENGERLPEDHFMVIGSRRYYVSLPDMTCDCPDFEWRGYKPCKHIVACQEKAP